MNTSYTYKFDRFGNAYHLRIESMMDLVASIDLNPALWVATSMPAGGVFADESFLGFIDADGNGRITHKEVCNAIDWTRKVLADYSPVNLKSEIVDSSKLSTTCDDAIRISKTIERIEMSYGTNARSVDSATLAKIKKDLVGRPVSENGVVLPEATGETVVSDCIKLAIEVTGGVPHTHGVPGLDGLSLKSFVDMLQRYISVETEAATLETDAPSMDVFRKHKPVLDKIDEFFKLCAAAMFFVPDTESAKDPDMLGEFPLSKINVDGVLRLDEFINPFYVDAVDTFRGEILVVYSVDNGSISANEWKKLRDIFRRAESLEGRLGTLSQATLATFARYSIDDLTRFVSVETLETIGRLVASSKDATFTIPDVKLIEKLSLYQQHLMNLANNFISFPDLYDRSARAWFEMGTLIIDNRIFSFSVLVENRAKHLSMAKNSSMYVLYVQVRKSREAVLYEVAVPVTSGDRGNLAVGKRGVFTDRSGVELDAEIVEIVDNPIDVIAAVLAPIRRLGKTVTGKLDTLTTEADQKMQQYVGSTVEEIGNQSLPQTPSSVVASGPSAAGNQGIGTAIFGGSVAIAAIGSAVAYIANTLTSMRWWQVVGGFGGVLAAVVVPAILLAILKLRRRDMSSIIEASGWAVNTRMKLTRKLQRYFSASPAYPTNSKGTPLHRRRNSRLITLVVIAAVVVTSILIYVLFIR